MRFNDVVPRLQATTAAAFYVVVAVAGCNGGVGGVDGVRAAASQAAADRAAVEVLASQAAKDRAAAAAELVAAKALADKQLAVASTAPAAPAAAPAAPPQKAKKPQVVSDPETLLRLFLTAWQAGDRPGMERLAKAMALQGFPEDPSAWSEFFVDDCALDGSGECGFNLVAPEGGSFTYLVSYSNAGKSGSLIIEEFEALGGGG